MTALKSIREWNWLFPQFFFLSAFDVTSLLSLEWFGLKSGALMTVVRMASIDDGKLSRDFFHAQHFWSAACQKPSILQIHLFLTRFPWVFDCIWSGLWGGRACLSRLLLKLKNRNFVVSKWGFNVLKHFCHIFGLKKLNGLWFVNLF